MNKSILLLVSLLCVLSMKAQDDYWNKEKLLSNEAFFEKAELVIEGKLIKTFPSYDALGNYATEDIYTVQAILVERVYKGDKRKTGDTVYVVRHFGIINQWINPVSFDIIASVSQRIEHDDDYDFYDHGVALGTGNLNILFLKTSDFPKDQAKTSYSQKTQYRFLQDKAGALLCVNKKITGLNHLVFNQREDFSTYIKQFEKYGVKDDENYYKAAEVYYQIKQVEVTQFLTAHPSPSILDSNIKSYQYASFRQQYTEWKKKRPVIDKFMDYSKVQILEKQLADFDALVNIKSQDYIARKQKAHEQNLRPDSAMQEKREYFMFRLDSARDARRQQWKKKR
ncbi:MAG: hypothetical protein LBR51_06285 [Bacteroidales bacterium]|jgi:hypothetical protein|nr:hypothetical protein [Bacteroidales bacterium]